MSTDSQLAAWGYDEQDTADHWKSYAANEPGSDLVEFEQGNGYWVYVSNPASLTVPAPAQHGYSYDSQGRRLGQNTVVFDGENQVAEFDGAGNLLVSYFQGIGIDNPISMTRDSQTYYYHTDALGSVIELTDSAGSVVQSYRYDAFGAIVQRSGNIQNPFTYTGRELDGETGLYYYRARYYDAEAGRFLRRDPLGADINLFRYAMNNPTKFGDPTGLHFWYEGCLTNNPDCGYHRTCQWPSRPPQQGEIYHRHPNGDQYGEPCDKGWQPPEIPEWVCELGVDIGCHTLCEPYLGPLCFPICICLAQAVCPSECE